jgi:peptide/nickel transport system substrate-binding protein
LTFKYVPEWTTRKLLFLDGHADIVDVPRPYMLEMMPFPEGIRCVYPLPTYSVDAMFFNYNVSTTSPYLGPGFDPANPYTIAEDRIPINFFFDIHVRAAFAFSFDYDTFFEEVCLREGVRLATPIVPGILGYNPDQKGHEFDLAWAEGISLFRRFSCGLENPLLYGNQVKLRACRKTRVISFPSPIWSDYFPFTNCLKDLAS